MLLLWELVCGTRLTITHTHTQTPLIPVECSMYAIVFL